MKKAWNELLLSNDQDDYSLWELFHLNSIQSEHNLNQNFWCKHESTTKPEFFNYVNFPSIPLPKVKNNLNMKLGEAIINRSSSYSMTRDSLTIKEIATLLSLTCAINTHNSSTSLQRRLAPSAGALYPIEIYFNYTPSRYDEQSILPGLYYYNPIKNELRLLMEKCSQTNIQSIFMQPELVINSTLQVFFTSVFQRSVQKYGDRGYKFSFLEAGHIAQNFNLVATAMKLSCINICGFYEQKANEFLKIDGTSHSTIYTMLIGKTRTSS